MKRIVAVVLLLICVGSVARGQELMPLLEELQQMEVIYRRGLAPSSADATPQRSLWSGERAMAEVRLLMAPYLAERTKWVQWRGEPLQGLLYRMRVQRYYFTDTSVENGYQLLLCLLEHFTRYAPEEFAPMVEAELAGALAEQLYPEATQLLMLQLQNLAEPAAQRALLEAALPQMGGSDESLLVKQKLLELRYELEVAPLEQKLLEEYSAQGEQAWQEAYKALATYHRQQIIPFLAKNRYHQQLELGAEQTLGNHRAVLQLDQMNVTTGEVALSLTALLTRSIVVEYQKQSKGEEWQQLCIVPADAPTYLNIMLKEQLPHTGGYRFRVATQGKPHTLVAEWVYYTQMHLLVEQGKENYLMQAVSATDGSPLEGVKVHTKGGKYFTTNTKGQVQLPRRAEHYTVWVEDSRLAERQEYYILALDTEGSWYPQAGEAVAFFPNQPIYKRGSRVLLGVVPHKWSKERKRAVLPHHKGWVKLMASAENGAEEELASHPYTTNKQGVAELAFDLPQREDLVAFWLRSDKGDSYYLNVAEYQRQHLQVVLDSIPTGAVVGLPMVVMGRTLDLNGNPTPATLQLTYGKETLLKGASGADGQFRFVTPPLQRGRQYKYYWGLELEITATDPLGNVATTSLPFTIGESNLALNASALTGGGVLRKDSVVLDFSTQPYHRVPLGSLSKFKLEGELRSSSGEVYPLGVLPMSGTKLLNLAHLPSGHYTLRLFAHDGQGVLQTSESHTYLYAEKDSTLHGEWPLFAVKSRDERAIMYGSSYGGTLILQLEPSEKGEEQLLHLTTKAGEVGRYRLPPGYEGSVTLNAFHQGQVQSKHLLFTAGNSDTKGATVVRGLETLKSETFLPGSIWKRELTLVNAEGQPLRHHPLLLTVYDKALNEATSTTLLWRAIGGEGMPYLYNERAVMEVAPTAAYALRSTSADKKSQIKAVPLRSNFAESAFFSALLTTDEQGKVRVNFRLPDTQTAYHLELFSYGKQLEQQLLTSAELRVQKPLSIELSLPRYLMQGDTLVGNAFIRNSSSQEARAWYEVAMEGTQLVRQEVVVPAESVVTLPFTLVAPAEGTALKLEGRLIAEEYTDGVAYTLPLVSSRTSYRVALPILFPKGKYSTTHTLPKAELADTPLQLWLYLSPLHLVLNHLAEEYTEVAQLQKLSPFELAHHLQVYSILHQLLTQQPQLNSELAQHAKALSKVAQQSVPSAQHYAQEATPAQLARLYTFLSAPAQRATYLRQLEQQLLSYASESGAFRYSAMAPQPSPWLTSYILEALTLGPSAHYSPRLQYSMEAALNYLIQTLEAHNSYYKSYASVALCWGRMGRNLATAPAHFKEGVKKELNHALAHYQEVYSSSQLVRYAELAQLYGTPAHLEPLLTFIKERTQYAVSDEEELYLAMQVARLEGTPLPPQVVRQMLQTKRGTLWSSYGSILAVKALLEQVAPTRLAPQVTLLINGTPHHLTPEERARGGVLRTLPTLPPSLSLALEGVESAFIYGGVTYSVEEPAGLATPTGKQLQITKAYFARTLQPDGKELLQAIEAGTPAQVGDQLVVRYTIKAEQDLSLLRLTDFRPALEEPGYQLSGFSATSGAWFYFQRRANHDRLYIDYLPRGTHILQMEATVTHAGTFGVAPAQVESLYAPEFAGNSSGTSLTSQ